MARSAAVYLTCVSNVGYRVKGGTYSFASDFARNLIQAEIQISSSFLGLFNDSFLC
jgi:hypothetical protein